MNKGFTLAEVLITLGIIGVVAALTIPTVVNKYREQATMAKVKKAYSIINQAYQKAAYDNGGQTINNWNCEGADCISYFFKTYFNNVKGCSEDKCKIRFYVVGLEGLSITNPSPSYYTILNDGTTIFWYSENENIWIITDGLKLGGVTNNQTIIKLILNKQIFHLSIRKDSPKVTTMPCGDSWDPLNLYKGGPGNGCPASAVDWIIQYNNMDYLHCPQELYDSGRHSCK